VTVLAIDTATSRVVVALGRLDGTLMGETSFPAAHRHGEELLPAIERLLAEHEVERGAIEGVVVGTGPGAFTGLRVGLATAKALAHALGAPSAGVATSEALIAAGGGPDPVVLLQPAGPSDRVVARHGTSPHLLPGGAEPELAPDEVLVAVDLEGRAPDDALGRGARAREGMARELVRLGAERLRAGGDDLASLVPEYVTLPRGVRTPVGEEVAWSHGRR
jgi:tRNA threonylcarbamoyl adenosine modification protein YeaZ